MMKRVCFKLRGPKSWHILAPILMILNHANVLKPKPNPHLFPPPRRAGEDEGGGTLTLNAPRGEKVFRLRNYGSK